MPKNLVNTIKNSVNRTHRSLQPKFQKVRATVRPYYSPVDKVDFKFIRNVYTR